MSDDSGGDVISELSPGPEPEEPDEERPDPESEEQQEELEGMLQGSNPESGHTSGSSDATNVVSDSEEAPDSDEPDHAEQKQAEREEALAEVQSEGSDDEPEPEDEAPEPADAKRITVDEVLKNEGVDSVEEVAHQYQNDMRTGIPAMCEYGCNIQPGEECPHGEPAITDHVA